MNRAVALILALTLLSGLWLALHPAPRKDYDLECWVFARTHYLAYKELMPSFEQGHPGVRVKLQLVYSEAIDSRLQTAFRNDLDVPDVVEINIDSIGRYFRGPVDQVGFVDLRPWLASTGYAKDLPSSRLAPYTYRGNVFGIPHDIHPVMLAYRRDIFEAEGVNVDSLETWDDFIREGRRLTRQGERYMIELSDNHPAQFEMFLFQSGWGYFDAEGALLLDDPRVVNLLTWYVPLVAGPNRIGASMGGGINLGQLFTQAAERGYILSFLSPDWRTKFIETDAPRLAGKMALMPLPALALGGPRASTMGGTMIGVTERSPRRQLALELIKHLYFNPQALGNAFQNTNILPSYRKAWVPDLLDPPRPYWSGLALGRLYADASCDVPPQYTHPFTSLAKIQLGNVITACSGYYRSHGDPGLEPFARAQLEAACAEIRKHMKRNPF